MSDEAGAYGDREFRDRELKRMTNPAEHAAIIREALKNRPHSHTLPYNNAIGALAALVAQADRADELVEEIERLEGELDQAHKDYDDTKDERDEAHRAFDREHELRLNLEDANWPYEWVVATAEREKRKAAEARADQLQRELDALRSAQRLWREERDQASRQVERAEAALREIEAGVAKDAFWLRKIASAALTGDSGAMLDTFRLKDAVSLAAQMETLIEQKEKYKIALEKIVNMDYRGNMPNEQAVAWAALAEIEAPND